MNSYLNQIVLYNKSQIEVYDLNGNFLYNIDLESDQEIKLARIEDYMMVLIDRKAGFYWINLKTKNIIYKKSIYDIEVKGVDLFEDKKIVYLDSSSKIIELENN